MQFAVASFQGSKKKKTGKRKKGRLRSVCICMQVQLHSAVAPPLFFFFGPVNFQSTVGGCWLPCYLPTVSCVHVKFKRLHILQDCRAQLTGISGVDKKL